MISEVQRLVKAPLERVWSIAGDFTKSPMPSMTFEIVQKGDEAKGGIGCIRKVRLGRGIYHERLEAIDPPNSYDYSMLSGGPFANYWGTVTFTPEGENTRIRWSVEFTSKLPLISRIVNKVNIKNFNRFLDGIENQI